MFGIGVEVHEVGIGQARHGLAVDVGTVGRIVRPPGLRKVRDRAFEVGEIGQDGRFDVHGRLSLPI
ncbi:hypothetical protein ACFSLT_10760 [Novosphingobium resinovorum]